jgi:hypothetical protein
LDVLLGPAVLFFTTVYVSRTSYTSFLDWIIDKLNLVLSPSVSTAVVNVILSHREGLYDALGTSGDMKMPSLKPWKGLRLDHLISRRVLSQSFLGYDERLKILLKSFLPRKGKRVIRRLTFHIHSLEWDLPFLFRRTKSLEV